MIVDDLRLFDQDQRLRGFLDETFAIFDTLDQALKYAIAYSGGKDSAALLAAYIAWSKVSGRQLDLIGVFNDTLLEAASLYKLVDRTIAYCQGLGIEFVVTRPSVQRSYWFIQFALGYPVPNHQNRWCTKSLKTAPSKNLDRIMLTGVHVGESTKRDKRISKCGSSECGSDKLSHAIMPISHWTNCIVWDWLCEADGQHLWTGIFSEMSRLYAISEDDQGSLRMGCFMCPVVNVDRISKQVQDGILPDCAIPVRAIIEDLRNAPRILSPRGRGKILGAILLSARKKAWQDLQQYLPAMEDHGWISSQEIDAINSCFGYPPTYSAEWIKTQEPLAITWCDWQRQKKQQKQNQMQVLLPLEF